MAHDFPFFARTGSSEKCSIGFFILRVFVVLKVLRALLLLLGLATLLHGARNVTPKQQSRPKGRRVKLALDRLVWPELSGRTASPLANMSLSPWTYK